MALKITLDTNCFFDYFERDPTHIRELIELQEHGAIEMAMTTRVATDTRDKWKSAGISPIWIKIQSFPVLEVIGTAFRLGVSWLGLPDYMPDSDSNKLLDGLRSIMRTAQSNDIEHLFGHIVGKRDIFITSDPHFLNHKVELKAKFGALVLKPEPAVRHIKQLTP